MKFNSQICTTREQSERLLALGLKKETADMHWYKPVEFEHDYWFMGIGPEEHYYYCASLDSNEAVHRAFYLGKEAVIIDILRMFDPLEG